jgi:hypothetical protein
MAAIRSIQTAVGWFANAVEAPDARALAVQSGLTYTAAPANGLATRPQFGGTQVLPVPVVVVLLKVVVVVVVVVVDVGGRLVVVVVVDVGGRLVVVVVVDVGGRDVVLLLVEPPHVAPLIVNDAGAGLSVVVLGAVPVKLMMKPGPLPSTAPLGTLPFHDMFVAVTVEPEAE